MMYQPERGGRGAPAPEGTSGRAPAGMRTDDFHFLAVPAPACDSKCVALISRSSSGTLRHVSQSQMTRPCPTRNVPCIPPKGIQVCSHTAHPRQATD